MEIDLFTGVILEIILHIIISLNFEAFICNLKNIQGASIECISARNRRRNAFFFTLGLLPSVICLSRSTMEKRLRLFCAHSLSWTCFVIVETSFQIFVSTSYDATSHFETTCEDVLDIFRRSTGSDFDFTKVKHVLEETE